MLDAGQSGWLDQIENIALGFAAAESHVKEKEMNTGTNRLLGKLLLLFTAYAAINSAFAAASEGEINSYVNTSLTTAAGLAACGENQKASNLRDQVRKLVAVAGFDATPFIEDYDRRFKRVSEADMKALKARPALRAGKCEADSKRYDWLMERMAAKSR